MRHGELLIGTLLGAALTAALLPGTARAQEEACCFAGTCSMLPPAQCLAAGGYPMGPNSTCPTACQVPTACCLEGTCQMLSAHACLAQSGVPRHAGTPCSPLVCESAPALCEPLPDGTACRNAACLLTTHTCQPRCVMYDPVSGQTLVNACECNSPNYCHVNITPGMAPSCIGGCPPGHNCIRDIVQRPDGTYLICCECVPAGCTSPTQCNDGNACTVDECINGVCVHTVVVCNDLNACTIDSCDADVGCVYTPIHCDDGNPCTADSCHPQTGCVHTPIVGCGSYPKFSQLPTENREDVASYVWITPNGVQLPNRVISDDFRSDGRPITGVRWWGSYLIPAYRPAQYGGVGQPPYMIDGWLIGFDRPRVAGTDPSNVRQALSVYFAPASAVSIDRTMIPACDGHEVFEYRVLLKDCCLIASTPDPRLPTADPCRCPGRTDYFCERYCHWYSLSIQAVTGMTWTKTPGASCCSFTWTPNYALEPIWGWHATAREHGRRPALFSQLHNGTAVPSPCWPLSQCPAFWQLLFGPWIPQPAVCQPAHPINMAFELLTDVFEIPAPCPPLLMTGAVSIKMHAPAVPPPPPSRFDINLPLDPPASAGVESRIGGPTRVEIKFNQPIAAGDGSLDPGDEVAVGGATVTGLSIIGDILRVDLAGAVSPSCVKMVVESGADGITTIGGDDLVGDDNVHIRVVTGDVNGDGTVNIFDLILIRNALGQPVTVANFRTDINTDMTINIFDVIQARNNLGRTAVCP